jgi:hypothetical protein
MRTTRSLVAALLVGALLLAPAAALAEPEETWGCAFAGEWLLCKVV